MPTVTPSPLRIRSSRVQQRRRLVAQAIDREHKAILALMGQQIPGERHYDFYGRMFDAAVHRCWPETRLMSDGRTGEYLYNMGQRERAVRALSSQVYRQTLMAHGENPQALGIPQAVCRSITRPNYLRTLAREVRPH